MILSVQRKHPSALWSFDEVAAAAKGKRIVMFMDYDGTLSPIVTDPDMAFMTAEVSDIDTPSHRLGVSGARPPDPLVLTTSCRRRRARR